MDRKDGIEGPFWGHGAAKLFCPVRLDELSIKQPLTKQYVARDNKICCHKWHLKPAGVTT
jgi:hypothetical protein